MRRARGAAGVLAVALGIATVAAAAVTLQNGTFSAGASGAPAEWHTSAWLPDDVRFTWTPPSAGASGTIAMRHAVPNDSRWCQTVAVQSGATYRITARARTSDVGAEAVGAHIAIERIADSPDLRGTQDWQPLALVVRAGDEPQWDVCLRLGSYANLNTGAAWFSDVTIAEIIPPATTPTARRLGELWEWARASGRSVALPLIGGLLLALGLGIGRRPRPS